MSRELLWCGAIKFGAVSFYSCSCSLLSTLRAKVVVGRAENVALWANPSGLTSSSWSSHAGRRHSGSSHHAGRHLHLRCHCSASSHRVHASRCCSCKHGIGCCHLCKARSLCTATAASVIAGKLKIVANAAYPVTITNLLRFGPCSSCRVLVRIWGLALPAYWVPCKLVVATSWAFPITLALLHLRCSLRCSCLSCLSCCTAIRIVSATHLALAVAGKLEVPAAWASPVTRALPIHLAP